MTTYGRLGVKLATALAAALCALAVTGCGFSGPATSSAPPAAAPVATPGHLPPLHLHGRKRVHPHGPPSTTNDPNAFAGYNLQRSRVTEIAASWRVPAIGEYSNVGAGGTWIGVQPARGGPHAPFIQVGTTDNRYGREVDDYEAFWSDTDHDFHPVRMMAVLPGERVSATLTLVAGRWRIRFVDHTSGQVKQVFTTQEAGAVLHQAEWLQEDPSFGTLQHMRRQPYAGTVPVQFTGLRANGAIPQPQEMQPVAMVLPHGELGPSAVHDNAFTVKPGPGVGQSLTPPASFTSGTGQPPALGDWSAAGTVTSSEGYADDPPGLRLSRSWAITRCPAGSGCVYSLSRTFAGESGTTTIHAALQQTPGGWRAVWPAQRLACSSDPLDHADWTQHEVWLVRFSDGGTVAQARESSFSSSDACGYGRSSTTWRATLASGS